MGYFNTTQRSLASGKSVFYGELYYADFLTTDGYYWDGFGNLSAYGQTWIGAANVVTRSEIPFGIDDDAGQVTLTMSGVDSAIVARVRASETEIYGRGITIWGQFFDEALQISDTRFLLFQGTMDVPTYQANSTSERTITIPCEGEWADRNGAASTFFSDLDQQRRYPGDRGCEYVYRYGPGVKRRWPQF